MSMVASQVDISRALTIPGWMSERELTWLATMAQKCKYIVEFGSFHGRSTRALSDNNDGCIWAIDPWGGTYINDAGEVLEQVDTYVMPQFLNNLDDHIKKNHVVAHRGLSYKFTLPFLVDMVFIDGDHRCVTVPKDINRALDLLKLGGIISGHDYGHPMWPGVKQSVDKMLKNVKVVETIWWTKKF